MLYKFSLNSFSNLPKPGAYFTIKIFLFLLLFFFNNLHSQIQFTRIFQKSDSTLLRTDFSKQNITWDWNGRFQSIEYNPSLFNWDFKDNYNSNLITPGNRSKRWKDQHNLNGLFYKRNNGNDYGLYVNSWILLDKQQELTKEYSNHSAGLFSVFSPQKSIRITPYLGYQRAKNISKTDWGWDVGIDSKISDYKLGNYNTNLSASSDYDFFETRQNYNNRIATTLSTWFSTYTSDSVKIGYEESSKQFYDVTGENIIDVKLYNRNIENSLYYELSPSDLLTLETKILSKNVSYFTKRDEFFLENRFILRHIGNKFYYEIDFRTNDETSDNSNTITDSRTRQSAIGIKTDYFFNPENKLRFDINYVKLQHDTPDKNNKDDRDEQKFVMYISYNRKISPALFYTIDLYGFLYHQIYLFDPQSSNNNWNRVLKLRPEVVYKNDNFSNRFSTSVIANYTVYDFDNLNFTTRSYLSRKYTLSDSVFIPFNYSLSLGVYGHFEMEERGNFFKKQFAQNLIQSYESKRINTFIAKQVFNRFNIKLGYTYYKRTEWRYLPEKYKNRDLINKGPFISIFYNIQGRISLYAFAAVNLANDSNGTQTSFNTGYLKMIYNL